MPKTKDEIRKERQSRWQRNKNKDIGGRIAGYYLPNLMETGRGWGDIIGNLGRGAYGGIQGFNRIWENSIPGYSRFIYGYHPDAPTSHPQLPYETAYTRSADYRPPMNRNAGYTTGFAYSPQRRPEAAAATPTATGAGTGVPTGYDYLDNPLAYQVYGAPAGGVTPTSIEDLRAEKDARDRTVDEPERGDFDWMYQEGAYDRYGLSSENYRRMRGDVEGFEAGDPGALNRYGQPIGTYAPLGQTRGARRAANYNAKQRKWDRKRKAAKTGMTRTERKAAKNPDTGGGQQYTPPVDGRNQLINWQI